MKKNKREKIVEPPEESIALRITNALIIVTCITVACMYAELPLFQTFLYVWFAITGCCTSYYFRQGKHPWLTASIVVGLLFVVGLFVHDLLHEFDVGRLENFAPFLAVIAGMQTVHAYDLQTRTDINVSTVMSLLLFTMTAVIGRDLLFGFFVMALVILGSALLYFEAVSRTKANQGSTQFSQTEITLPFPTQSRRMASGSAVLPIAALPVMTIILFACLPRVDSIVDVLMAKFHPSPIKVDDKGFNFMSGTGKGPGKGQNGSGTGEGPGQNGRKDASAQASGGKIDKNGITGQGKTGGSTGAKAETDTAKNGAATGSANKDGNTGKDAKATEDKKEGTGTGGDGKGKPDKDGKDNASSKKDGDKKVNDRLDSGSQSGPGADKKSKQDEGNKGGSGGGKVKHHGEGANGGFGDSGEEEPDDPAKKARLEQTHLTESDELVFRNKESADFDDSVFMRVRSEQPVYLRRDVFDKYDGKRWIATIKTKPAICEKSEKGWTELGGVPQLFLPSDQKTTLVSQTITAQIGLGRIIPAASVPQRVDMGKELGGSISVDEYGVLRTEKDIPKGTVFRIESRIPSYDVKKMHEAERDAAKEKTILAEQAIYLQLPENLPPEIKKLTEEIVIADDNFFNRADRICKHLRTHYQYSSEVYRADSSEDLVANFLFKKKEGACGEFTSAFVVMCRQAGVPARCVGGYAPGTPDNRTGRREITGLDGHAWGEVCIPNIGWVPFDASPKGIMPENSGTDDSWFGAIKRAFDSAEAAFQSSQQDRDLGKGSEEDYKAAPPQPKPVQDTKQNEHGSNAQAPGEPGANPKDERLSSKENGSEGNPKDEEDVKAVSPLGRRNAEAEQKVLNPTEKQKAEKTEKVENKSFTLTWQEIAIAVASIPFAFLIIRFGLARFRRRSQDVRSPHGITPSTVLYLKMTEDLKRLKILRKPSDTTEELTRRFSELVEIDDRIHPELEGLFLDFIELYAQERFSEEGHNAENYKDLKEIGNRIHTLSKTRLEKQRN